jgi:hypothetical protein
MNLKDINIIPLKGLSQLNFGIPFDEALKIMGDPETTKVIRDSDELISTVVWDYSHDGLRLYFEGEPKEALACCEIENKNSILFDKHVFKMNEAEVRDLMAANGYYEIDEDFETWGEKRVSYEDALIDFYFVNDKLVTINFGVFINREGDVEWPVKVYSE